MGVKTAGAGDPATLRILMVGFVEHVIAMLPPMFCGMAPSFGFVDPATGGLTVPPPAILIDPAPVWFVGREAELFVVCEPPPDLGVVVVGVLLGLAFPPRSGPLPEAIVCEAPAVSVVAG